MLQVSDCEPATLQLRALMDARNSSDAWDLRCLVREKMVEFIQKNYPGSLPKYRGEFATTSANGSMSKNGDDGARNRGQAVLPQASAR